MRRGGSSAAPSSTAPLRTKGSAGGTPQKRGGGDLSGRAGRGPALLATFSCISPPACLSARSIAPLSCPSRSAVAARDLCCDLSRGSASLPVGLGGSIPCALREEAPAQTSRRSHPRKPGSSVRADSPRPFQLPDSSGWFPRRVLCKAPTRNRGLKDLAVRWPKEPALRLPGQSSLGTDSVSGHNGNFRLAKCGGWGVCAEV